MEAQYFTDAKKDLTSIQGGNVFEQGQAVFARNYGRGEEWIPEKVEKVLGWKNYVILVDINGEARWKRHVSQIRPRYHNRGPSTVRRSRASSQTGEEIDDNHVTLPNLDEVDPMQLIQPEAPQQPEEVVEEPVIRRSVRPKRPPDRLIESI